MKRLTLAEIQHFKDRLRDRRDALYAEFTDVGSQEIMDFARPAEEWAAILAREESLSSRERHTEELHDIEGALVRIDTGVFGICIDCDGVIPRGRLRAYPTAKRCFLCQGRYEHRYGVGADKSPSL